MKLFYSLTTKSDDRVSCYDNLNEVIRLILFQFRMYFKRAMPEWVRTNNTTKICSLPAEKHCSKRHIFRHKYFGLGIFQSHQKQSQKQNMGCWRKQILDKQIINLPHSSACGSESGNVFIFIAFFSPFNSFLSTVKSRAAFLFFNWSCVRVETPGKTILEQNACGRRGKICFSVLH